MSAPRPVTIVGGGLAGLTLGIALRQRNVPVVLWEADRYPRHRVCGEFISGRGRQTLVVLGLEKLLRDSGACEARTSCFHARSTTGPIRTLPEPALCISRFALDATLASEFRTLGGELREGERYSASAANEGVVRATGRRPQTQAAHWRWFGIKTHARNVKLESDLEMHLLPNGYVGICRLADGIVNVCGLFRRNGESDTTVSRTQLLRGEVGTALNHRLANAEFLPETTLAVGGLNLRPELGTANDECRIGDALTMIPPFTGNGMSMAFESAELARDPLEQWSRGQATWLDTRNQIARRCDLAFRRRLQWAGRLHALMFFRPLQSALAAWLPRSTRSWDFLFSHTR